AFAYLLLLATLLWNARRYAIVNLQFSGFWPAEWIVMALLRRKFVYTIHNAVPHGFVGQRHRPTERLATLARSLVFVSEAPRGERCAAGVVVQDGYLAEAELLRLLADDVVFVLPYRDASQSGALYALLNHGRFFICADAGDLGAFMRRHGLEGLLLRERGAEA